jgi:hypothetical protein
MPAWMAGIQMRRMRPETSMSAWIPALHAGTTESRSRPKTDPGLQPQFSKELIGTKRADIYSEQKLHRHGTRRSDRVRNEGLPYHRQ